jgi:hypothetical protein
VDVLPHGPAADAAAGKKGGKVRRAGSAGFCQQESTGVKEGDTAAVRDQDAVGQAALAPELVGFVLLDPLWEGGQEVGYVASVMRMKRSAHAGEHATYWGPFMRGRGVSYIYPIRLQLKLVQLLTVCLDQAVDGGLAMSAMRSTGPCNASAEL